jgi:hypothetical protein
VGREKDAAPSNDASPPARDAAVLDGAVSDSGFGLIVRDAGPAVSPDGGLPERDPDAGIVGKCSGLLPWTPPAGVTATTVVQGGDGFVGLVGDDSGQSAYVFDAKGDATARLGKWITSHSDGQFSLTAGAGHGVTAALLRCMEGDSCGSALLVEGQGARLVDDAPGSSGALLAVAPDGKMDLAVPVFGGNFQLYDLRLLVATGAIERRTTIPASDFTLIELASDDEGSVLVFARQTTSDSGAGVDEVLVSVDRDLNERGRRVLPAGRVARALRLDGKGKAIAVGTALDAADQRVWLDAFDAKSLEDAWDEERLGEPGNGLAVDVTPAGDVVLLSASSVAQSFTVQTYDASGVPQPDAGATIESGGAPGLYGVGVSVQKDGSIFVATPIGPFVSCQ